MKGKFRKSKIGVLMGGLSGEREISVKTGTAVLGALERLGYNAAGIDIGRDAAKSILSASLDAAFVALHGPGGEDGTVQGLLEIMGIPYTGTGVLGSAMAMSKSVTKDIFLRYGIATPGHFVIRAATPLPGGPESGGLKYPVVVKPSSGGSTLGLTVVHDRGGWKTALECAREFDSEIIVERYILGKNLTVPVIGLHAFPAIEMRPKGGLYDYKAKYTKGETEYLVPAPIDQKTEEKCRHAAVKAHRVFECRGVTRTDFIAGDDGEVYALEINTIPGMTETSLVPMSAAAEGVGFDELVERILDDAALKSPIAGEKSALRG